MANFKVNIANSDYKESARLGAWVKERTGEVFSEYHCDDITEYVNNTMAIHSTIAFFNGNDTDVQPGGRYFKIMKEWSKYEEVTYPDEKIEFLRTSHDCNLMQSVEESFNQPFIVLMGFKKLPLYSFQLADEKELSVEKLTSWASQSIAR